MFVASPHRGSPARLETRYRPREKTCTSGSTTEGTHRQDRQLAQFLLVKGIEGEQEHQELCLKGAQAVVPGIAQGAGVSDVVREVGEIAILDGVVEAAIDE